MLKRFKVFTFLLCITMMLSIIASCSKTTSKNGENEGATSGKAGTAADSKSKELVVGLSVDTGLDIQQVTQSGLASSVMFDTLVTFDKERKNLVPNIAESINFSEDGKVITIKLPEGLTFTNGDPLNAEAVKASFERLFKLSQLTTLFADVSKVEAPDPLTVVITCSQPSGAVLTALTCGYAGIVDAAEAKKVGDQAFLTKPIGYGAFYLKEWSKDNYVVLERNDKFKTNNPRLKGKGAVNFETVKFRFIPNNFTMVNELIAGNIDFLPNIPIENLETLRANKDINVFSISGENLNFIIINPDRVKDIKVRNALQFAISREQLKTAMQGSIEPVYGPLCPKWIGFNKDAEEQYKKDYAYNAEKAKALLAEAGYKDTNGDGIVEKDGKPLELEFTIKSNEAYVKTLGPVIQTQLKQVGIKINLKQVDAATLSKVNKDGDYDITIGGATYPDAIILNIAAKFYNYMKNSSDKDKFDKLLLEAQNTLDIPERAAKYTEAGKLLMNYSTVINLYTSNIYVAARKNLKGVEVPSDGSIYWNGVTKE